MSQEFTIGRDDAGRADILLPGSTISGIHSKVGIDATGKLWISDAGSSNGTELLTNGKQRRVDATPVYITSGDILVFGGVEYSVEKLFSLLPSSAPAQPRRESKPNVSSQAVIRCTYCGSVTFPGRPCVKCGR